MKTFDELKVLITFFPLPPSVLPPCSLRVCQTSCSIIINGNWEHLRAGKPFPRDVISCIKISKHERIYIDMWWIHKIGSINTNGNEAHVSSPHCRGKYINPGTSGGPQLQADLTPACSFLCFQIQLDK